MKVIISKEQLTRISKGVINEQDSDFLDQLLAGASKAGKDIYNKASEIGTELFKTDSGDANVDIPQKASDNPRLADTIGTDVPKFFEILDKFDGELTQQAYGSMRHQQEVEAVQIGLELLGYDLPRFGVDGLFGPETALAVNHYKSDKNLSEAIIMFIKKGQINEVNMVALKDTSFSHVKFDNDSTKNDLVNDALLEDLEAAASAVGITATITTAKSGHSLKTTTGNDSRHGFGIAVDIAILNGLSTNASDSTNGNKEFRELGNQLKDALVAMGYKWNIEVSNDKAVLWQTNTGGNHYNHLHVSNKVGVSDADLSAGIGIAGGATITRAMIDSLSKELKAKGVTSEDLKRFVDEGVYTGGGAAFTDLDLTTSEGYDSYTKICDNFIGSINPNAFVTGDMMAKGAKNAYERYHKYVPPELALAQITLEGGLLSDTGAIPIKTKNPFNVGNTKTATNPRETFQDGVNIYYNLIASDYLVKGKTASNLANDFANFRGDHYAEAGTYEKGLRDLISTIRKKNAPIYATLTQTKSEPVTESYDLLTEADKRQAIKNAFGFNDVWANEFHRISDKISVWIADTFLKEMVNLSQRSGAAPEGEDDKHYIVRSLNEMGPTNESLWSQRYKPGYEFIMHWVRSPRREQLNLRDLTYEQAYQQAEEWHDTLEVKTQQNYQEENEVFIDYRNGNGYGYYWTNLHKGYCQDEQERMGHCGRSNNGELVSLRRINEFGEGTSLLTLDYRPGGIVGDFHRHGNKKPTTRFHPQIVDFLINQTYPVTELTRQGVHRYEDNFQLSDLSPADLEKVYRGNPSLKYNFADENTWPTIIDAMLSGEIDSSNYSSDQLLKLLGKSKRINKLDEFKTLFTDDTIIRIFETPSELNEKGKEIFLSAFSDKLIAHLTEKLERSDINFFINSLRYISQHYFGEYQMFCPFIDQGFRKFADNHVEILGNRGFKRTLLSCTDSIEFLQRYSENLPVDRNGNISVKTEEGLWGLIKSSGETILHPRFHAVSPNPTDRTGKTYIVKNAANDFFIYNIEDGSYKKWERK